MPFSEHTAQPVDTCHTPEPLSPTSGQACPDAGLLAKVCIFEGLTAQHLERLAQQCRWQRYAPGEQIVAQGAHDRHAYFLVQGKVRASAVSVHGRQVTYRDLGPGQVFGELAALDGRPRSAEVVAVDASQVAVMTAAAFRAMLLEYPTACDRLMERMAHTIREMTDRVFALSTLGVQNRLHAELLRLARDAGIQGNQAVLDPAPKHSEMASQISTYREQITRELSNLSKRGLIRKQGRALLVADIAKLQQLVDEVRAQV